MKISKIINRLEDAKVIVEDSKVIIGDSSSSVDNYIKIEKAIDEAIETISDYKYLQKKVNKLKKKLNEAETALEMYDDDKML